MNKYLKIGLLAIGIIFIAAVSKIKLSQIEGLASTLTSTEINYSDGLTAPIQTQLNAKLDTSGGNYFNILDTVYTQPQSDARYSYKRWAARVGSVTSAAAPTINTDNYDIFKITAQTETITSFTTNLTGTPVDGDILEIQITGTSAIPITWGASFVASTVSLPTTTVTTTTLTGVFQWYTTSSYGNNKWVIVNSF